MDCFVALLAMTSVNFLAALHARVLLETLSLSTQRAQGMPGALHTRGLVCIGRKHTSSSPQVRRNDPAFPAQWCYGLSRALPGDRALIASVADGHHRQLDPSIGGTGPHAFAVRTRRASSNAPIRPSHPALTSRDDREAPLFMSAGWVTTYT